MGGFELLDLHDFLVQGTALVGVLDPFWDEKGYITAGEFHRFCNSTVPLARLSKRVFTNNENLRADIEVAHFGPAPIENASVSWSLRSDTGEVEAGGQLNPGTIPIGNGIALGSVNVPLQTARAPAKHKLVVRIASNEKSSAGPAVAFENDWDIWVYPAAVESGTPSGILIAHNLTDDALSTLDAGGKVLIEIPPRGVRGDRLGKVALGFSSIFWNTAWTQRQAPHTLGILCDPAHPAFAEFPTDYHSNWQWWYLVSRAGAMILDDLPTELSPMVQAIDDWVTNRKLGLVFEAKMGRGKLLVCSIDLENNLDTNPVARQLRYSLLRYMAGSHFNPAVTLTVDQLRRLFQQSP